MMEQNRRMQILDKIDSGEISPEEGLRLLKEPNDIPQSPNEAAVAHQEEQAAVAVIHLAAQAEQVDALTHVEEALSDAETPADAEAPAYDETPSAAEEPADASSEAEAVDAEIHSEGSARSWPADADKWRRWWMIPLWIGVAIVVIGGLFMLWAFQAAGFGFGFICASAFFTLGLVVLVLAAQSRTARWLHLRVKQRPGERPQTIAISLPIPLRFTRWAMRIFGGFIPDMHGASVDDIMMALDALEDSATPDNPVFIEVDEEDGEHVEIYIG
ncbi:MAG: hypothetical protein U9R58_11115 [Chloroflexota bacterium]|nr:hypothetical protein [Chloroflexota bacterium]